MTVNRFPVGKDSYFTADGTCVVSVGSKRPKILHLPQVFAESIKGMAGQCAEQKSSISVPQEESKEFVPRGREGQIPCSSGKHPKHRR